jgi:hypothetical protein
VCLLIIFYDESNKSFEDHRTICKLDDGEVVNVSNNVLNAIQLAFENISRHLYTASPLSSDFSRDFTLVRQAHV